MREGGRVRQTVEKEREREKSEHEMGGKRRERKNEKTNSCVISP